MGLRYVGAIDLPAHVKAGGFDHAAVHVGRQLLYVAHTANDAVDVVDCIGQKYLHSVPNLSGAAGVVVSEERNLVFTSNRGEGTVGIFSPGGEASLIKIDVKGKPNGLAYDSKDNLLLAANVGDPNISGSATISIVNVGNRSLIASVPVPGRTRWAIFDAHSNSFLVNVMEPPQILVIDASRPSRLAKIWQVPSAGPHGLDLDIERRRLFCACDGKQLIVLDADSGSGLSSKELSGVPDVVFYNQNLKRLYVAIGDPGVIDVFDSVTLNRLEVVSTERGAHTIAFDTKRNKVFAFLPQTHRAAFYVDEE